MPKNVISFLFASFLITLFAGLVYGSTQQVLRQGANDPQIQIAEDVAGVLAAGKDPKSAFPSNKTDIRQSLSSFVMVFDNSQKLVGTSGLLDGKAPVVPSGVFDYAKAYGQNRFSWEPALNVREAAVLVKYDKGFVLAARSLREIEIRENKMFEFSLLAWVVGLGASFFFFFVLPRLKKFS